MRRHSSSLTTSSQATRATLLLAVCATVLIAFHHPVFAQTKQNQESEGSLENQRRQYFYDRETSGGIKDFAEIKRRSFAAYQALQNPRAFRTASSTAWQEISPGGGAYVCGRLRALAFDPTNPKVAYIGAAEGGVWKTTDITSSTVHWTNLSAQFPTLLMGALAVDPNNHNVIYAGTGEIYPGSEERTNSTGDGTAGMGIWKSTDGGMNWNQIADASTAGPTCSQIAISPSNSNLIFDATGSTQGAQAGGGLIASTDGGASWVSFQFGTQSGGTFTPISVIIDPTNSQNVYISTYEGDIFVSNDGGAHFQQTWSGAPHGENCVLAIALSSPNVLYASFAGNNNYASLGIWRSSDGGMNWSKVNFCDGAYYSSNANFLGTQGWYANAIAVSPTNPNEVIVGGLDTYTSLDGGANFTKWSQWYVNPGASNYSHADVHFATFNEGNIYLCTDGGLSVSTDDGTSWNTRLSSGIDAFQFIGVDAPPDFSYIIGGTQDNGVQRSSMGTSLWTQTRNGDGGITRIPSGSPQTVYSEAALPSLSKSTDGGQTWLQTDSGTWNLVYGNLGVGVNQFLEQEGSAFYAGLDVSADGNTVAEGGKQHVFVATDGAQHGFTQMSNQAIGETYVLYIVPNTPTDMAAGTNLAVFFSTDQGLDWGVPNYMPNVGIITGITSTPDAREIYIVSGGLSTNENLSFVKIQSQTETTPATNLPQIPINCIARAKDGTLFLGTDYNVLTSTDDGVTWSPVGMGLPPVQVLSLQVRGTSDQYIVAGTYGRGTWVYQRAGSGVAAASAQPTFTLAPPIPSEIDANSSATVSFNFERGRNYSMALYNTNGQLIRTIDAGFKPAGNYQSTISTSGLAAGMYFVALSSEGQMLNQKLLVQ